MEAVMEKINIEKYPFYKDSGAEWLGEIPKHWDSVRMKHLFRDVSIKNRPAAELLSVTQDQGVVPRSWVENRMVMPSGALESFKFIHKGDFAISLRSFEGGLEYCHHDGIISPAYTVLKAQSNFENQFYKYLFKSYSFISELQTSVVGIRQGKNISYQELSYSFIPIPPRKEQTVIAQFLDRKTALIDQAIGIKEKQIELLKERRQILVQRAVTRGINPNVKLKDSGVEWIGEIPEGWEVKKLGYLALVGNGSTPNRSNSGYWQNGIIPWLNSSKVNDETITSAEQFVTPKALKECHLPMLTPGTIVIAITGEGKTRGMSALCEISATINQHLAYIKVESLKIDPIFLLRYLQAMYANIRAESSGLGSTKGAITCESIKKYIIPLPHILEQLLITEYIENIKTKVAAAITLKEKEIDKLQEYKASLINSAVTGKIKVS